MSHRSTYETYALINYQKVVFQSQVVGNSTRIILQGPWCFGKTRAGKNETKRHIVHVTYRTGIITSKLIKSKSCQSDHPTTREENWDYSATKGIKRRRVFSEWTEAESEPQPCFSYLSSNWLTGATATLRHYHYLAHITGNSRSVL